MNSFKVGVMEVAFSSVPTSFLNDELRVRDIMSDSYEFVQSALAYQFSDAKLRKAARAAQENLKRFSKATVAEAKRVAKDMVDNWEATTVLVAASVGISFFIGEWPAWIILPGVVSAILETTMVTPVLATLIVILLVKRIGKKARSRS